jgi:hypothetical protein
MPNCLDCYYFNVEQKTMCRRFPPTQTQWPTVQPTDWCGEHQAGIAGTVLAERKAKIAALEATAPVENAVNAVPKPPQPPAPPPQPQPPAPPQPRPAAVTRVTPATTFPVRSGIGQPAVEKPIGAEAHTKHLSTKHDKPKSPTRKSK